MRVIPLSVFAACVFLTVNALVAGDDIQSLIKTVNGGDKDARLEAMDKLGAMGSDAESATAALTGALASDDNEIRARAARTLGTIGPAAKAAVPALTEALSSDDGAVRGYAAFALGRMEQAAMPAVEPLINLVFDKDQSVRMASLRALQRIDPPTEMTMPHVLEILRQGDMTVIMPALYSVAEEGQTAVPRLREALKHEEACYWACIVLAELGPDGKDAVPELIDVLNHELPDVRLQALLAIGEIGEAASAATPAVLDQLKNDPFENNKHAAAFALGKIRSQDKEVAAALRQSIESQDEFLAMISAWALARSNPQDKRAVSKAVELIVDGLSSEDGNVRRAAARTVVDFDVDPQQVAPALVKSLENKDPAVVMDAIGVLASMGDKVLDHIDDALENRDLRPYAVVLIGRMGPKAKSAVPALVRVLQQEINVEDENDLQFRREVQLALAAIGPSAEPAVDELIKSLSSKNDQIKASAAFALGRIGKSAAAPRLAARVMDRKNFDKEAPIVKLAIMRALLQLQPQQAPRYGAIAAPILIAALDDENELIRAEVATALGEIGNAGKRAVPQLREMQQSDESEMVRDAAAATLRKLGI